MYKLYIASKLIAHPLPSISLQAPSSKAMAINDALAGAVGARGYSFCGMWRVLPTVQCYDLH